MCESWTMKWTMILDEDDRMNSNEERKLLIMKYIININDYWKWQWLMNMCEWLLMVLFKPVILLKWKLLLLKTLLMIIILLNNEDYY